MITSQNLSWYWHRLRSMDGAEIARRIARKTFVYRDRKAQVQLDAFRLGAVHLDTRRLLPDRAEASDNLRGKIQAKASAIREGKWCLFGWLDIQMADPPQWDWDSVQDLRAPLDQPVSTLDHRCLASGADPRAIWEINRWSEIVVLAQNAWLNGKHDDAHTAQCWLDDWITRNPIGCGINWTSTLEVGLRLINFHWIDVLLHSVGNDTIRANQERLAERILPSHVWWVWQHRSHGSSANNHLLGELAGLILATRRWPSLMHLACCAEKSWQQFQEEVIRQFASDGGNREQALHYHLFALEMALQAQRVMGGGNAEFKERLSRAAFFFGSLCHPQEPWDFGDSDDAEITPFTENRRASAAEWCAWFLRQSSGEAIEFWLGPPPVEEWRNENDWTVFPESQYAVKTQALWMVRLDASPLGFGTLAAHGHLDALHVSVWHGDLAVFIDPGTGAYYSDTDLRARLADWSAHNAPMPISGRPAPRRAGPFMWRQHHEPPQLSIKEGKAVGCLACDGPFVKRQIAVSDSCIEVADLACNQLPHVVTWTLAPAWRVEQTLSGKGCFRLSHTSGLKLYLTLKSNNPVTCSAIETRVSPRFGETVSTSAIRVQFSRDLETALRV